MASSLVKLKYCMGINYLELLGQWAGIKATELVSQKWEECDLMRGSEDSLIGCEGSKEVLPKETREWQSVWPINIKVYNFFIDAVRGFMFDGRSLEVCLEHQTKGMHSLLKSRSLPHCEKRVWTSVWLSWGQWKISLQLFVDVLSGQNPLRSDVQKHSF